MKSLDFSIYLSFFKKIFSTGLLEMIFSNFLVQLSALITIIFLADILSPEEVGFFRLLFAYFVFFQILGLLGCNASILKFCSENVSQEVKVLRLNFLEEEVTILPSKYFDFNIFIFLYLTPISEAVFPYAYLYFLYTLAVYSLCSMAMLQALKEVRLAALIQGLIRICF